MKTTPPLSNETIILASMGHGEELQKLLECFDPYISKVATEIIRGPDGSLKSQLNEDRKSYIQTRVIEAVLKWKVLKNDY